MAEKSGVVPMLETIIPRSCGETTWRMRSSTLATSFSVTLRRVPEGALRLMTNWPASVRGKKERRRARSVHAISQGYGVVGRVYDHGGGGRNLLHHAAARHIAAQSANALLHERATFHFFEFVADLLFAHLQIALVPAFLPHQVDCSEHYENKRCLPQQRLDGAGYVTQARGHCAQGKREIVLEIVLDQIVDCQAENRDHDDGLE